MSGRRIRNLVLLAAVAGLGYWIYRDRPTLRGIVDTLTNPIMGNRAAVKSSERNRVVGDATTAISEQVEMPVEVVKEGMWGREVRELLGKPDKIEREMKGLVTRTTWTYTKAARVIVLEDDHVVSISVLR
jgi:hypothetical protein